MHAGSFPDQSENGHRYLKTVQVARPDLQFDKFKGALVKFKTVTEMLHLINLISLIQLIKLMKLRKLRSSRTETVSKANIWTTLTIVMY